MIEDWESIVDEIKPQMGAMHRARESALGQCRILIQTSARCIRHVHRRQFEEAKALLEEGSKLSAQTRSALAEYPELLFAGYLQDAEKEMVEASAVLAIAQNAPLPSCADLGVQASSYLNGLGEAASECRRYVLDEMRKGRFSEGERLLTCMETIYDDLITFDYPDSLTGGLRRTCDALRAVIERTRSDLTMTQSQQELLAELRKR